MEAKNSQVGSLLQTEDGRIIDIDKIEKRSGQFEVYNFKVEDFYTYFVSEQSILVHNTNCGPTDNMWDELDNFQDPVQDAVDHIMRDHPERLHELRLRGPEDIQNLLDDLYNNAPQTWSRPDGTTAYIDTLNGTIFIDNPRGPTVFRNGNYNDYLTKDGFTQD